MNLSVRCQNNTKSGHEYYFQYKYIEDRYEAHYVTMILYDRQVEEKQVPTHHDNELCLVCFERIPATTVIPCHHHIVCRECSHRLRETNDHHTCLQCRCPIEQIIEDP